MGVILQVALPSRVLAAARLQCGAAGAGASRGLGVCAEHARLAARGESARAMEIGDFLVWLGPVANSQCETRSRVGGFMASGAKNQLRLVNVLGAPTLRDGSVGQWDGKERFFPDDFDAGGHL